jgi:hypothetical protein
MPKLAALTLTVFLAIATQLGASDRVSLYSGPLTIKAVDTHRLSVRVRDLDGLHAFGYATRSVLPSGLDGFGEGRVVVTSNGLIVLNSARKVALVLSIDEPADQGLQLDLPEGGYRLVQVNNGTGVKSIEGLVEHSSRTGAIGALTYDPDDTMPEVMYLNPEDGSGGNAPSCSAGGTGATECSIECPGQNPSGCSVKCAKAFQACCGCGTRGASCGCY